MTETDGALALKQKDKFLKYKVNDVDHLIEELRSLMPLSRNMIIYNIKKYGYEIEENYILESLGFSANKNKKIKVNKDIEQQAKIFQLLFYVKKECYIRIRNKSTEEYRSYNVESLKDPYRLQAILKSQYFSNNNDMMYSLNCFNNMYKHTEDTLFSLQNFALDVDFDTKKYTIKEVKEIIKKLYVDEVIPIPNVLEYGHRIRLIYSIQDVPATVKSKRLLKKIANAINDKLPLELNSSVQALTTSGRIIDSINTKNMKKVQAKVLNPNKYILRQLQKKFLDEYEWIKNIKKANSRVVAIQNCYTLNLARLRDLEKIQRIREDGYKEYLCYLYRNYCLLSGMDKVEAWQKTLEFNNKFNKPKRANKLNGETKTLNRKQYLHKNETILKLLDIDPLEEINLELETIVSNSEYRRRKLNRDNKRYRTKVGKDKSKKEEIEEIRTKIKSLKLQGFKNKDIALRLNLAIKTLERHITYLKKNGLL